MKDQKFNLYKKNVLITGAAGLLGSEHAKALLECNASVVLTDIDIKQLILLKKELEKNYEGKRIFIYEMDVRSENSIRTTADKLKSENLLINTLINNAAIDPKFNNQKSLENSSRLENFPLQEWNHQIEVGLTGAFLCSKVFGNDMAKYNQKGCIVNIASDLSVIAPDQRIYSSKQYNLEEQPVKPVTYSVIKSGLIGLTKYLSTYWIGSNIRCNALSPGGIFQGQSEEFLKKVTNLIPMSRMASKSEYRGAIQFLCSDASAYMNGHNLIMDGGRSVW